MRRSSNNVSALGLLRRSWKTRVSPQWNCVAFLVLIAIPALLYGTHALNYQYQHAEIEDSGEHSTSDVNNRISELKTLLASLVGLYYASDELEASELSLFSRELHEHAHYITGTGRYTQLNHHDREALELRMSESGLYNFKITAIDSDSQSHIRPEAERYYPITTLDPMQPGNLKLLGADLSTIDNLSNKLDYIAAQNETLIARFPNHWPFGNDLILFRTVYRGKRAPVTPAAREQHSAGGFWVSIDVEALLQGLNEDLSTFDLTVKIKANGSTSLLYSHEGEQKKPTYLKFLYPQKTFSEEWTTGNTSLVITLQRDLGYSSRALMYFGATLLSLLLVSGLYTTYVVVKKNAVLDRQKSRDALFEEREKAENTLNSVQDAIISLDAEMRIVHINPAAIIQFDAKTSDTIGHHLSSMVRFHLVDDTDNLFNVESALASLKLNSIGEFNVVPVGQLHSDLILRLTLTSSCATDGKLNGHVLVLRDISQEQRLTQKLEYQATHDALTGCTNRFFFEQTLAGLIDELPFSETTHALCYMDLDQFKVVNDTCGHRAGDRLLVELTRNMSAIIREGDVMSRLGGDEFGLLMINVSKEEITELSQRIYDFFQNYIFRHDSKAFAIHASIGIVHIDQGCDSVKDVLSAADIACYAAKDAGRNSMYVYSENDEAMTERSVDLSWLPRLQNALQNNEFLLHVQAIAPVSTLSHTTEVNHFEFLLRLANPDGTVSTPWQFIQAAERYDLMREIDRWVIQRALRTVAELKGLPGGDCCYSINLSGQSAADPSLKAYIREQMHYFKIDPPQICFEITETAAISHFAVAVDLIDSIHNLGSKVALDDFGSGLSSFGYLKNLPVDILKIDGQFIQEIASNAVDKEMVRAIHHVGRSMGIKTVAEFVESQAIVNVLKEIGIDYAQGYHIGKPCDIKTAMAQFQSPMRAA